MTYNDPTNMNEALNLIRDLKARIDAAEKYIERLDSHLPKGETNLELFVVHAVNLDAKFREMEDDLEWIVSNPDFPTAMAYELARRDGRRKVRQTHGASHD